MKYRVNIKMNRLTQNTIVLHDSYSAICFVNNGTDAADAVTINNAISLAPGARFSFNDEPYVVIDSDFRIESAGNVNVTVLTAYYYEI